MSKVKMNKWVALGDVNPMEHGGTWIKQHGEAEFEIVSLINLEYATGEPGFMVDNAVIDINDDWIDYNAVRKSTGTSIADTVRLAYGIFWYYGAKHCGGGSEIITKKRDTRQRINSFGIVIPRGGKK